ncbi:MAG: NmrA family NAD(P)-binding protein [Paucibacter sp.]|nr:NmrA family NAD(P)-binding protein [Roseateles sp.]
MYAIMGVTGQVGGVAATALLDDGHPVRAIVRSADRAAAWRARGCEVAIVPDASDARALAAALEGVRAAFLMNPPNYDPEPGFPDTRQVASAFAQALTRARPAAVVFLSTVGAHVERFNLLNNGGLVEHALRDTGLPVALLRPAWFLENVAWDVASARGGAIETYLQPPERAIDMVSVRDIGATAAELLQQDWSGARTIELAGPAKVSPNDIAAAFTQALGRRVGVRTVTRADWEARFRAQGMRHPEARIAMLDGFNAGWLDFSRQGVEQRTGSTPITSVVHELVAKTEA